MNIDWPVFRVSTIRNARRASLAAFIAPVAFAQSTGPQFKYPHESITIISDDVRLSAAFFKPSARGPFPAIVVVHGSGHATYDEVAFRVHANAFLDNGFAVLLYDKRGSGASTGDLETSDYEDLAGDVLAGVRWLRSRSDIVPGKIGLLGRSEGGWVASLAAQRDRAIAFVIMSSGSAVSPYEETLYWTRGALRAHGAPDRVVERALSVKKNLWAYYRSVAADSVAARGARSIAIHDSLAAELGTFEHYRPEMPADVANPRETSMGYYRAFSNMMYYDPAPTFNALRAPLLELLGAEDEVVEPKTTIAVLERLRGNGHDVTVRVFPGVGHSLVLMTPDGPRYPADYLDYLTQWARKRAGN